MERTDPQCIARPSPLKSMGITQRTEVVGTGHNASCPLPPSVNGRGKAWLTDGGVDFAEASVSQSNRFAGFFPLPDPQCIARPSPFKVNGDQSTDGGSGHEA